MYWNGQAWEVTYHLKRGDVYRHWHGQTYDRLWRRLQHDLPECLAFEGIALTLEDFQSIKEQLVAMAAGLTGEPMPSGR